MCGGGPRRPSQREDGYNGKLARQQREETNRFIKESRNQQREMAAQLEQQLAITNQITLQRQQELAAERAAAEAEAATRQTTTYATATTTATPTSALTTEAIKPVRKKRETLKIEPGSTANQAGAGLNLGV